MSTPIGTWRLAMRTPIGTIHADVCFQEENGTLVGRADGAHESVPLRDIVSTTIDDGTRVTWSQTITKPLRLHLDFDVTLVGDRAEGQSRAGRLPRTLVSGTRLRS